MPSPLSVLGLTVSLFATSTLGLFTNPAVAQSRNTLAQPQVATVKKMVTGDLMCYVTLVDEKGVKYESVGATFEICANEKAYLNKKVELVYRQVSVNDCQSSEPCGKTRRQYLIVQMKTIAQPQVATVKKMVTGDLMCYVTLVDQRGVKYESVGATFEICANEKAYLNKKVNLVYRQVSVNDCQSSEPCGKTRRQSLIVQMNIVR
ncbi:MAG: hypothetical protein WBG73_03395 [Coleofasciculaceae cyanobacterium]